MLPDCKKHGRRMVQGKIVYCPDCKRMARAAATMPQQPSALNRVMARIERLPWSGCWIYMGRLNGGGYGHLRFGLRSEGKRVYAHRVTYEAFVGPIPEGLQLDHLCRIRCCVNPDHLEPVTCQVNVLRGKGPPAINAAKLTCLRGHALVGENLSRWKGFKGRDCKLCRLSLSNKRRRQRRAELKASRLSQSKVA